MFVVAGAYLAIPDIPAMAEGLSSDGPEATAAFDVSVREQYPIGSSATALKKALVAQGFHEGRYGEPASDGRPELRCPEFQGGTFLSPRTWHVCWSERDGKVFFIAGGVRNGA